jgi:hypothetical protein
VDWEVVGVDDIDVVRVDVWDVDLLVVGVDVGVVVNEVVRLVVREEVTVVERVEVCVEVIVVIWQVANVPSRKESAASLSAAIVASHDVSSPKNPPTLPEASKYHHTIVSKKRQPGCPCSSSRLNYAVYIYADHARARVCACVCVRARVCVCVCLYCFKQQHTHM